MDEKRELLRHTLATLAYRAARAIDGAPDRFAGFDGAGRMPVQILSHMGDLFDWALSIAVGKEEWHRVQPRAWAAEKQRFFQALGTFDSFVASGAEIHGSIERLMQGPVADAPREGDSVRSRGLEQACQRTHLEDTRTTLRGRPPQRCSRCEAAVSASQAWR